MCGLGWVEEPHTDPPYQRHGLARAGLAAVRRDHPGLQWHTLGGHFADARAFWSAAATDVPGGYEAARSAGTRPGEAEPDRGLPH